MTMDDESYFRMLEGDFDKAYEIAGRARAKGFDPHEFVEIKIAPDLPGKVEALLGVEGIGKLIQRNQVQGKSRGELSFNVIKEICTSEDFAKYETLARIELAVRTGLGILTDGVLVAPTEGMQRVEHFKNPDNSDYVSVSYAGPIRSAGGTAVALSAAFADYARKFFGIGAYKATHEETERYIEELESYHAIVHLQYKPSPEEIRTIIGGCGVCIDGVPTEDREVSVHTNIVRKSYAGKDVVISNRIRGGVPLVVSSIAQKAKGVLRDVKKVDLDWNWLNNIITVPKKPVEGSKGRNCSVPRGSCRRQADFGVSEAHRRVPPQVRQEQADRHSCEGLQPRYDDNSHGLHSYGHAAQGRAAWARDA